VAGSNICVRLRSKFRRILSRSDAGLMPVLLMIEIAYPPRVLSSRFRSRSKPCEMAIAPRTSKAEFFGQLKLLA
jgi:hypothetical protein